MMGGRTLRAVVVAWTVTATIFLTGPAASAVLPSGTASVATAEAKIVGKLASPGVPAFSFVGLRVAAAGDTNGDGYDDFALIADAADAGGGTAAYLFLGPVTGTLDPSQADAAFTADLGVGDISGAGDVNGDGNDDLLISAMHNAVPGTVWVIYGPMSGTTDLDTVGTAITGEAANDDANTIAGPGDVNGDGFDDILIGAAGNDEGGDNAGAVYLVLGPVGPTGLNLSDADAKIVGVGDFTDLGAAIAGAGDVNGDGLADIIIGSRSDDAASPEAGAAYVFLGPISGALGTGDADATILGEASLDAAGDTVAGVGDLNGDGFGDVAVTAPRNGATTTANGDADGFVYVVEGPISGTMSLADAAAKLHGEDPYVFLSTQMGDAGDLNGDGVDDLMIGLGNTAVTGSGDGVTYVEFGPVEGAKELSQADVRLVGETGQDFAGLAASGVGDTNGDGVNDIVIGAPYNTVLVPATGLGSPTTAGAVYLFLGSGSDTTPPTVTGSPDRSPNGNGWYSAPVTIDWHATDDSGQATDPPNTSASTEATNTYTSAASCDPSNNCATGQLSLSIDLSNPSVSCQPATFSLNQTGAVVSASVTDAVSGPASATVSAAVSTSAVGASSVSLTGTDRAGRITTVSCPYRVAYAFTGFLAPVDNPPAMNLWLGGLPVPIRFALHGNQGSGVVSSVTVTPVDCRTKVALGAAGPAAISPVVYTPLLGQYAFLWSTLVSWRGSCRLFVMNLRDGTAHGAYFQFIK